MLESEPSNGFLAAQQERLLELCYQVKGEPLPQFDSRYHLDIDNFRLEKWVNLDLWNEFLKMRAEKGKPLKIKQKNILLNQLKDLKNKNYDLEAAIAKRFQKRMLIPKIYFGA